MKSDPFIFFGTPYVARDTLAYLVAQGYVPALVVTSPDARQGRGMELTMCETKAWALEHGLRVLSPEKLSEIRDELVAMNATYALVVAYGKILSEQTINLFPKGVLNVHYSLLPKYRGASPVEAALLHGDTVTGVSIQKMVYELDAGDVIAQQEVKILPQETTKELRPRLVQIGAELLVDVLPEYLLGTRTGVPQDASQVTHMGKIAKEEGHLSLADDAVLNWNKYRAYAESPGTFFFTERNGKHVRVKIKTATLRDGQFIPLRVVPEGKSETDWQE